MILGPWFLADSSFTTIRWLDIAMNRPSPEAIVPSLGGPVKKAFFFLIRLAWESRVRIPYLIAVAFMALDIRMQLEITVDRAIRQLPDGNDAAQVSDDDDDFDEDDDDDDDEDDDDDDENAHGDSSVCDSSMGSMMSDSEVDDQNKDKKKMLTFSNNSETTLVNKVQTSQSKETDVKITDSCSQVEENSELVKSNIKSVNESNSYKS